MRTFLGLLVRLFPRGFRRQFGDDIRHQIRTDYDRVRTHGPVAAFLFALPTAIDLFRSALAERWDPTWTSSHRTAPRQRGMGIMLSNWINDLRHAVRALRRAPGFVIVTVATLGLAIGANVAIFATVDAVLLDPLPFRDADRLVRIAASIPGSDFPPEFGVAAEFYVHYRDRSELIEEISTFNDFTSTLKVGDRVERVRMSSPTPTLFATLGATPMLGRLPTPEEEGRTAVISHRLWVDWFGTDPDVVGRSFEISQESRTIVGVMGPDFWFPNQQTLLWYPERIRAEEIETGQFGLPLVARLTPGVETADLRRELAAIAQEIPERFGVSASYARLMEGHRPVVRTLEEELLGEFSTPIWVLMGAVGLVLLIACANVANLFLVRAEHRQSALAVRRALGAHRRELIRSQLAEALVIAGLAGALAGLLAWVGLPLLIRAAPDYIPRIGEAGLSVATLLFTVGASLVAALLCGLGPAIRSSAPGRTRLREADTRGSTGRRHWGRDGLVVVQTALALVLLIGCGLLARSFQQLQQVDPGYDLESIFTFQIAPEPQEVGLPSASEFVEEDRARFAPLFARFHLSFMDRLATLPGVESVGLVENLPLNEGLALAPFVTEETVSPDEDGTRLSYTWAGGDYFETMGIELLQGRTFERTDHVSSLGNVVISRAAAQMLWPGQDPIGRRLRLQNRDRWETVVGVVEDVMQDDFRGEGDPLVYFSLVGQYPDSRPISSPAYVLKTRRASEIASEVRALVREAAPNAPMYRIFTMEQLAADSMVALSFTMTTLGIAAALALVLGAIGLVGVLSYVVVQRTREIGVRMALGAEASRVRRMVVSQGVSLVGMGIVIGVLAAVGTTRALGALLFGVAAIDIGTFVVMSAAMVLIGLLASYLPARRASSVDPIESLRPD